MQHLKKILFFTQVFLLAIVSVYAQKAQYKALPLYSSRHEILLSGLIPTSQDKEPSVIIAANQHLALKNPSGEKDIPLSDNFYSIIPSRSDHYFAVIDLIPLQKSLRSDKQIRLTVYSAEGSRLYTIEFEKRYDDPMPVIGISDGDGAAVIGQSALGKLTFYNSQGQIEQEVDLFPDAGYDLERHLQFEFAQNGNRLAVLAGKRGVSPLDSDAPNPSAEPYLFLFDEYGQEIRRQSIPETAPHNMAVSPDGNTIFVAGYTASGNGQIRKNTRLLQADGKTVTVFPLLFRSADFSAQSGRAVLADRSSVYQINTSSGKMINEKSFSPDQGIITAARWDQKGINIFLLFAQSRLNDAGFIFTKPIVRIIDPGGREVQTLSFPDETFTEPSLRVRDDKVMVGFSHHLYRLEVQQ